MPPVLRAATSIAPSHLLYCPNCWYKIASKWKPSDKFGWCVKLSARIAKTSGMSAISAQGTVGAILTLKK
jgi:hypothetical protein